MSFLNARDIEDLRSHLLAIKERVDQSLRILNRGSPGEPSVPASGPPGKDIPDGAWKDDPATLRQLAVLNKAKVEYMPGLTKGGADNLIKNLLKKVKT